MEGINSTLGGTGTAAVLYYHGIARPGKSLGVEIAALPERHDVFIVGSAGQDGGAFIFAIRPVNIGIQYSPVPHFRRDVYFQFDRFLL
jgi:hypothetical protein